MSKKITRDEVRHMAALSRLNLSGEEENLFTTQLGQIVDHMDVLNKVSTDGVEPLYSPLQALGIAREDIQRNIRERKDILANAPETDGVYFIVPRIV